MHVLPADLRRAVFRVVLLPTFWNPPDARMFAKASTRGLETTTTAFLSMQSESTFLFCQVFHSSHEVCTLHPPCLRCANYLSASDFPEQPVEVGTWCMCGPRQQSLVDLGTILSNTRRRLSTWEWPDNVASSVDAIHGAHFDSPASCVEDAMAFRFSLIPENASCSSYSTTSTPLSEWSPNATQGMAYCADGIAEAGDCCIAGKGFGDASRVFRQVGDMTSSSVEQAFLASAHVGLGVYPSSAATVGDFNTDAFPDIVIGTPHF